ncbi:MAG: hypothetical protein NkDv07_0056 [Candidatus Improbicoccus devescovinae]|nr:MAG: hypothetical protein NkDv07_0056 [Candidatus Improbicoccus devescovinae]
MNIKLKLRLNFLVILLCIFSFIPINSKAFLQKLFSQQAIIFVPGVMESGLFYTGVTDGVFSHNENLWLPLSFRKGLIKRSLSGLNKFSNNYSLLGLDDYGEPINNVFGVHSVGSFPYVYDEEISKYGVRTHTKALIDNIANLEEFTNWDIIFNNYDWRIDPDVASERLANLIRTYEKVVLIGFSYGGLISSKAAVNLYNTGELQRIDKYVSIGVPYKGSVDSLIALEQGLSISTFQKKIFNVLHLTAKTRELIKNFRACYQLLPSKQFFNNSKYYVSYQNKKINGYQNTIDLLKTREYAIRTDKTIKDFFEKSQQFYDSLYINNAHILHKLNYHIIVGTGIKTLATINIKSAKLGDVTPVIYESGDGRVLLNKSAILDKNIDAKKIFRFKERHPKLISNYSIIKNIIKFISYNPEANPADSSRIITNVVNTA